MWHTGRLLGFSGLLAAFALFGATEAQAQKKKASKDASYPRATDADYKAIQKQKELSGKLVAVDTGVVTLRVEYQQYAANPKYKPPKNTNNNSLINQQNQLMRTYNNLMMDMQRSATARTPQQAQQAQRRIAQDLSRWQQQYNQFMVKNYQALVKLNSNPANQPFITVTATKDFDLDIEDKATYRKLNLPFEYDDAGNVKTYTDKEKAELRGTDKTKPGYTAKFEELHAGQEVKLYLTPPPKKSKSDSDTPKKTDPDAPKKTDSDTPMTADDVPRPTINMILITKDDGTSSSSSQPDNGKKKKKN
ncbi:MAG TPA: hypothetical protein VFE62_07170 [Gemmataceae bacterium]|nr:hypothetical protein [Gemmataceae bacterium]